MDFVTPSLGYSHPWRKAMTALCPECEGVVRLTDDVMEGEIVPCADCGTELEVLSVNPLRLGPAPEVQEDWGE